MFPKQLFYLASDQLHAYQWLRGSMSGPTVFPSTRAGVDDFMAYLDRHGNRPAYLLADLIEEDFCRIELPHVRGRAGRLLRERRLVQQYRETPYRTDFRQGRSTVGRRDDIVLFTALTNPLLLTPWVDAMELMQTPLAGIYSPALLGRDVLQRLDVRRSHILLVTRHAGGLRQTYFRAGQVKFSRLVQLGRDDDPIGSVASATRKTQQFLTSVRLLERGDVLHVVVLADATLVDALAARCENNAETIYRIVPIDTVTPALGLSVAHPSGDTMLLAMLARHAPASHYPTGDAGNYYKLWRARLSLYASSAVVATCALAWSIANLAGYALADNNTEALLAAAQHYRSNYQRSMSSMPPAVEKTVNMRAAVSIDRTVARQGPWPTPLLAIVSGALDQAPQIRLLQLDWRANVPGAAALAAPGAAPGTPGLVAPMSSLALGIPTAPSQTLRLQAEVIGSGESSRKVLDNMNGFAQRLAATPNMAVEIVQLPFDIRPAMKLSGAVGGPAAAEERNKFTLDLTWKP